MGCINLRDNGNKEELKKHSIYVFEGHEEFEKEIEKGADYEFAVICANSNIEFLKELKKVFEKGDFNKDEIVQTIERLPGRIIIVGQNSWWGDNDNGNLFKKWIKKRICWVENIDINSFDLDKLAEEMKKQNSRKNKIRNPERFKLKLYELWVGHIKNNLLNCSECGISLKSLNEFGEVGSGGLIDMLIYNREIIFNIFKSFFVFGNISIDDKIINFSLLASLNNISKINNPDCIKINNKFKGFIVDQIKCLEIKEFIRLLGENKEFNSCINVQGEGFSYEKFCKDTCDWVNFLTDNKMNCEDSCEVIVKLIVEMLGNFQKSPIISRRNTININEINLFSNNSIKINFLRHGEVKAKKEAINNIINFTKDSFYHENLSGSSTHFSIISSDLSSDCERKYKTVYSLIENGLFRVLVADERVARFVGRNYNAKNNLSISGIDVVKSIDELPLGGSYGKVNIGEFAAGSAETFQNLKLDGKNLILKGVYHILIIHQGILDKISSVNSKVSFEDVVQFWKENYFPYVFITSGRGVPPNVPKNAKFIPFSIVESSLIQQYHEKFILTKILMKSLTARE